MLTEKGDWMRRFLIILLLIVSLSVTSNAFAASAILNWVDNSGNNVAVNDQEAGFNVERKLNTGVYALLGTVGANVTSFTDNTLVQGLVDNTYCYRVQAFNTAGNSAYTNEACKLVAKLPVSIPAPASNLTVQ